MVHLKDADRNEPRHEKNSFSHMQSKGADHSFGNRAADHAFVFAT